MAEASARLRLNVVQAAFGDCLLVEARSRGAVRRILIDGGPGGTWDAHLRPLLASVAKKPDGAIDVAVLSHIDNDHVTGLLDLFDELRNPPPQPVRLPPIRSLWHNSFAQAVGSEELEPAIRAALIAAGRASVAMPGLALVMRGVGEGDALRNGALGLRIPLNEGFPAGHVLLDGHPPIRLGDLAIHVVGPSRAILGQLEKKWLAWLTAHRTRGMAGEAALSAAADQSIPNLSSIVLLVELGRRSLLLTGDARSDQVLAGLREAGLLDANGRRHVSVLKMPHHGSIRNIDPAFLAAVTADVYVISADGRYGNPDYEALVETVEAAHRDGRRIELAMTNVTPGSQTLARSHPPSRFGYRVRMLPPGRSVLAIDAAAAR